MLPLLGPIIGAGASLIGAGMASSSAKSGAKRAAKTQRKINAANLKWQGMFAKRAIRWRVNDAKKAGIHPLAALGAQTHSFAPSFQADNAGAIRAQGGAAAGEMVSNAGQDIARAVGALSENDGRLAAYEQKVQQLNLQNLELKNMAIASHIATQFQPGSAPAMNTDPGRYNIDGQGQSVQGRLIVEKPLTRTVSGQRGMEPGSLNETGFLQSPDGKISPVQSGDAKERLEEDLVGTILWNVRNRLIGPMLQADVYAPPGLARTHTYDPLQGSWVKNPDKRPYESDGNMSDAFNYD